MAVRVLDDSTSEAPVVIPENNVHVCDHWCQDHFPVLSYWQSHGPVISFTLQIQRNSLPSLGSQCISTGANLALPHAPRHLRLWRTAGGEPIEAEGYLREIRKKLTEQKPPSVFLHEEAASKPTSPLTQVTVPATVAVQSFVSPSKQAALHPST
jgi:hypothetical protein